MSGYALPAEHVPARPWYSRVSAYAGDNCPEIQAYESLYESTHRFMAKFGDKQSYLNARHNLSPLGGTVRLYLQRGKNLDPCEIADMSARSLISSHVQPPITSKTSANGG